MDYGPSATATVRHPNDDYIKEFWCKVHSYARSNYDGIDAEDVTQETITQSLQQGDIIGPPLDSRVFAIADGIAIKILLETAEIPRSREIVESPEEIYERKVEYSLIRQIVYGLTPIARRVLEARFWLGEKYRDLCRREKIKEPAARQVNRRALAVIRKRFERACLNTVPVVVVLDFIRRTGARTPHALTGGVASSTSVIAAACLSFAVVTSGDGSGDGTVEDRYNPSPMPATVITVIAARTKADIAQTYRVASLPTHRTSQVQQQKPSTLVRYGTVPTDGASIPIRSELRLAPNTRAGNKQRVSTMTETPLGPVGAGEQTNATGPATVDFMCSNSTCPDTPSLTVREDFGD